MTKKIIFLLLSLISVFSFAQKNQFNLSGTIEDTESNMLPGANIRLTNTNYGTAADKNGHFEFKKLNEGLYTIEVSYLGYETMLKDIELNKNLEIKIHLKTSSIITEEVIVKATRAGTNTPMAYQNIKSDELKTINVGQDLPVLLDLTPSVVTTTDAGAGVGYTGIRVRGSDATRVNVTINGIPVNDAESHGVWWVNMPDITSSVQDIQIQRGVGTSTNGAGAFGASINLQTEHFKNKPFAAIDLSGGSFNTNKETIKFGTGNMDNGFSFSGRVSSIMSDGYIDRASSDLKSYFLNGSYKTEKSIIKLIGFGGRERTYQSWNGIDPYTMAEDRTFNSAGAIYHENGEITYYDDEVDNYQQHHIQLLMSHQFNAHWTGNLNFHYTRGLGYYEQYKQDQYFSSYGLNPIIFTNDTIQTTDLIRRKWLDNHFAGTTYGLHYSGEKLNVSFGGAYNNYFGDHYGKIIWARFASQSEKGDQFYFNDAIKKDFNSFIKADYQLTEKLAAFADIQIRSIYYKVKGTENSWSGNYNVDLKDELFFVNPKAGLFYKVNDLQNAFLSFAVGNREPNRTDYLDGEKQPEHETLYDTEIGYNLQSSTMSANIIAYYMYYTNQLVLTGKINDVGSPIRANIGESYRAGLELSTSWKPVKILQWQLNLNLSDNKNLDFYTQSSEGELNLLGNTNIAYSPSIIAGSKLSFYPLKNLSIALLSKYVGEQYMSNSEMKESILEDYFISNISLSYSLNNLKSAKEIRFNLLINNIFDTEYISNGYMWDIYPYYYPQAGINFLGGISINF